MIVIPTDMPLEVAPLAWMLGRWSGWGMLAVEGDAPDIPVVEDVRVEVVGTQVRMTTTLFRAQATGGEIDPTLDAMGGLALLTPADLLRSETVLLTVLPGSGVPPTPGDPEPRELKGRGCDTDGFATLWVGVGVGPRVQLVSDAIAREDGADAVEHFGRMYGLVGGEMMWTQERRVTGEETRVDVSGRLARIQNADEMAEGTAAPSAADVSRPGGGETAEGGEADARA